MVVTRSSLALLVVVVCTALVGCATAETGHYLDQHTDLNEDSLRLLLRGTIWQTFNASWSSSLVSIEGFLGSESDSGASCEEGSVTVYIGEGLPDSFQDLEMDGGHLMSFTTEFSCSNPHCINKAGTHPYQCAEWMSFVLPEALPLASGNQYSFGLRIVPNDPLFRPVMGVSPPADNQGGPSSLVRSPLFATAYTQYTFRTFMSTPADSPTFSEESTASPNPHASTVATEEQNVETGNSNSPKVGPAGIIVPVFAVIILVAVIAFVVVQRKKWRKEKIMDSSNLYQARPEDFDELDNDMIFNANNNHSRRHVTATPRYPIYVQAADDDDGDNNRTHSSRWAQDVTSTQHINFN